MNTNRKINTKYFFILTLFVLLINQIQIKKIFSKDFIFNEIKNEDFYVGSAGLLLSGSAYFIENKDITDFETINKLNKNNLNFIDKSMMFSYNSDIKLVSDITVYTSLALPILYSLVSDMDTKEIINYNFKYAQLQFLNAGINMWTKNLVTRYRPYVYDTDLEISKRQSNDGRNSFYSGHTTMAFASAVFFAYSIENTDYTRLTKNLVWAGSLGLASSTGILRIMSGQHYFTDVMLGAIVGSGLAILIIESYKQNINITNTSKQVDNLQINYFTFSFKF